MNENQYRVFKAIMAIIFVVGILLLGYRYVENGRYQQTDFSKQPSSGAGALAGPGFFDTRTGEQRR